MVSKRLFERFYPSDRADGTVLFYDWVREHTTPETRLLNLGAGPATGTRIRTFKGEVAHVIGADIDPIVFDNDELDEAVLIENDLIPLDDECVDMIVSDYTFEHVQRPEAFLAESARVLRPGGSLFFRTPSKHHYVAMIARMTPHWFHKLVANRARGFDPEAHEPWPTVYALNSRSGIRRLARSAGFSSTELRHCEAEPSYLMFATVPFLVGVAYERTVNSSDVFEPLRANIFGRLVK